MDVTKIDDEYALVVGDGCLRLAASAVLNPRPWDRLARGLVRPHGPGCEAPRSQAVCATGGVCSCRLPPAPVFVLLRRSGFESARCSCGTDFPQRAPPLVGQPLQGRQGRLISDLRQIAGHGDLRLIQPGIEQPHQAIRIRFGEKLLCRAVLLGQTQLSSLSVSRSATRALLLPGTRLWSDLRLPAWPLVSRPIRCRASSSTANHQHRRRGESRNPTVHDLSADIPPRTRGGCAYGLVQGDEHVPQRKLVEGRGGMVLQPVEQSFYLICRSHRSNSLFSNDRSLSIPYR